MNLIGQQKDHEKMHGPEVLNNNIHQRLLRAPIYFAKDHPQRAYPNILYLIWHLSKDHHSSM
jgi:hypothetical protein